MLLQYLHILYQQLKQGRGMIPAIEGTWTAELIIKKEARI
jgi:hypothetical protein